MIDAEYEELDDKGGKLDLADTDSLPWLEAEEDDETAGGVDGHAVPLEGRPRPITESERIVKADASQPESVKD